MTTRRTAYSLLLILCVLAVYSNHFRNDFQFDDTNAITNNPAIRQSATILRAFADPNLFSAAPEQRTYRPVTTASLALDYWLAGGPQVFFFHLSTFLWYSVLLVLMFLLFERIMNLADPHPSNVLTALAAAAAFGLHPANAETVNYIVQRGDLYNALGCIAGLWLFIRYPAQRRFGWYLLPAVLAMLAKPPALVFPVLLMMYVLLFEHEDMPAPGRWKRAIGAALPSLAAAGGVACLLARMQSHTWNAGAVSPGPYRLTQPFVALHYFESFFFPASLNVDSGWHYVAPLSLQAVAGYLFVLALLAAAFAASRTRPGRPVAFGILWFFVTLLPTSLTPLGDVTNDHRMFFSFVGLTLAVFWGLRLALFRKTARLTTHRGWAQAAVGVLAALLIAAGVATRVRNRVWLTHESLWGDSVAKNPRNPRALSNYAAVAYEQADYQTAFEYWDRAVALDPNFGAYLANLARASIRLHRDDLADRYLRRIITIFPSNPVGYLDYATWLASVGRYDEAVPLLNHARELDPRSEQIRRTRFHLLTNRNAADRTAVFRALDSDHDARISAGEMIAAPATLLTLDKNGDGKLSAEDCGVTRAIMLSDPLLRALDVNHDGEISADEIRGAEGELGRLDRDRDGVLETWELVPDYVTAAVLRVIALLDLNRNGQIDANEWALAGDPLRILLAAADIDGDGVVTREELTNEILYRAGHIRNGIVTRQEVDAEMRSCPAKTAPAPSDRK